MNKSHDLLQEEIVISVYNIAAADFEAFFSRFLPQFLGSVPGVDDGQKAVLAANFTTDQVRLHAHTHNLNTQYLYIKHTQIHTEIHTHTHDTHTHSHTHTLRYSHIYTQTYSQMHSHAHMKKVNDLYGVSKVYSIFLLDDFLKCSK